MDVRPLGKSELKVSALSLGAMTFGESHTFMRGVTSTTQEARRVFDCAVDHGINLIDTADMYGDGASERLVGEWIHAKRGRVLVATKCFFPRDLGVRPSAPDAMGLSSTHIVEACEASLKRLGVETIDLYQAHMQDTSVPIERTLDAFERLVAQGKIRYFGCSNYTGYRLVESLWAAEKAGSHRYESVQLQWSLAVRDAEREVIPACRAHGLGVLVWGALARGFLSGKYQRGAAPPANSRLESWKGVRAAFDTDRMWALIDVLHATAKRHETTASAIAIAWLLAQPETTSVVVGARTDAQLLENLKALEVSLTPDEVRALVDASEPSWGYPYDFISRFGRW